MKTYVVGIDGSETAARGRGARRRAGRRPPAARCTSCAPSPARDATTIKVGSDSFVVSSLTTAEQVAEQQAATFRARGSRPRRRRVDDKPADALLAEAERLEADLIVVGNRRMQGVGRLLGSVANEVAHNAPCDVLIVKTVVAEPRVRVQ